jgi:uncharacterized membrane protein YbhN (UPF0104 family)
MEAIALVAAGWRKRPDDDMTDANPGSGWRTIGSWAFSLLALAAVVAIVSRLGEMEAFLDIARRAEPLWLLAALPLQLLTYVAAASVWYVALRRTASRRPLAMLVPLGVAKLFADQAVPSGGLSGTLLVIRALGRRAVPHPLGMAVLLVGLVSYYTAYLIATLAAVTMLAALHAIDSALLGMTAALAVIAVAIPAAVLWLKRNHDSRLRTALARIPGIAALVRAVADAPTNLIKSPALVAATTALQFSVFVLDAATLWVMLHAVAASAPPAGVFASFMVAAVSATVLPVPLGLGAFEGAAVAALNLVGVELESALTATLLLRGVTFWLPMLPGIWLARRELRGR